MGIRDKYDVTEEGKVVKTEEIYCEGCGSLKDLQIFRYNDFNGFVHSGNCKLHLCDKCIDDRMYTNDFGYTFIKTKDNLYVKEPNYYSSSYTLVRSDIEIEKAFNPDRFRFEKWLRER